MFITKEEIYTHLYAEIIDKISGEDETILIAAIDGAISEAKGYLHNYDIDSIFSAVGESRNALLVIFVKDIAVWHYINLANPGTDLKLRQDRYNAARSWLKEVKNGEVLPDLPKITNTNRNYPNSVEQLGGTSSDIPILECLSLIL